MKHKNIINFIEASENTGLVLEFAENGELF